MSFDDPKTFALLSSGKTTGIFQLESSGMRDLLIGLKPDRFEDIIAIIALYRPGPMDLIPDFIKRKQGKIPDRLRDAGTRTDPEGHVWRHRLSGTGHGHRQQGGRLFARPSRYSPPRHGQKEARGDGKTAGANSWKARSRNNISEKKADKLYELIQKFAGYGFNKSHAAAYAVVCYQTAYLKAHYPTEFMAALMTTDMGNADKIVGYFTECRGLGIPVLPPDMNQSHEAFHRRRRRHPFRHGRHQERRRRRRRSRSSTIRNETGPFPSFFDLFRRVDLHKVNKRMMEGLIKAGAFDSMGGRRSQYVADPGSSHG